MFFKHCQANCKVSDSAPQLLATHRPMYAGRWALVILKCQLYIGCHSEMSAPYRDRHCKLSAPYREDGIFTRCHCPLKSVYTSDTDGSLIAAANLPLPPPAPILPRVIHPDFSSRTAAAFPPVAAADPFGIPCRIFVIFPFLPPLLPWVRIFGSW